MLRSAEMRVLDVAIACGFKTQQHFARVFRQMCGASPMEIDTNPCAENKQLDLPFEAIEYMSRSARSQPKFIRPPPQYENLLVLVLQSE